MLSQNFVKLLDIFPFPVSCQVSQVIPRLAYITRESQGVIAELDLYDRTIWGLIYEDGSLSIPKEIISEFKKQWDLIDLSPFEQWLIDNYDLAGEVSGSKWWLSKNPTEYLPLPESDLERQFLLKTKEFHLVVQNNKTFEILYHRELTGEKIFCIEDYLPEIENATGLKYTPITPGSIWCGSGEIGMNIAFNKPSEEDEVDDSTWDYADYRLA